MKWHSPLLIGQKATAISNISSVEKKGFEKGSSPMVFVKQRIAYSNHGSAQTALEEERSHVYLSSAGNVRRVRQGKIQSSHRIVRSDSLSLWSGRSDRTAQT